MLYNFILEKLILPSGDFILGTNFISELRRWRKVQWEDYNSINNRQLSRLSALLTHSLANVEYYKNLNVAYNPDPAQFLKKFPLLTKEIIKNQGDKLIANGFKKEKLIKESSSGSSGIQSTVYLTKHEVSKTQAAQILLWEWSGFTPGWPMLQLGMTPQRGFVKKLKDYFFRVDYQQAFNISRSEVQHALLRTCNKNYIFGGYASGLYGYALIAEQLAIDCSFKAVISWGDKMFPHYRTKIENLFKTRVFDIYGTTEGFVIAGQCPAGSYHILSPHVYLELLDEKGNEVGPGQLGYVVVTRLDAYAMPLIRFYLGDIAVKEDENFRCTCGRHLPVLRQIIGRDTDIVRTSSGKLLIVHFFTGIFEHVPQIRQFRIVQKEFDRIIVEYIPEPDCSELILNRLRETIQNKLEEKIIVDFVKVTNIPNTPSGKPQIIKSELPLPL